MRKYWNIAGGLRPLEEPTSNSWIQVTCPSAEDCQYLENEIKIPDYFLNDIADIEERSRYEIDEGWYLIILRIPYAKEIPSRTPFTTIPLGIIIKNSLIITVCNFETDMMNDFLIHQQRRGVGIADPPEMVFRLFLSSAVWYLKRLKQISTLIEQYKRSLDHNIDNVDLINFRLANIKKMIKFLGDSTKKYVFLTRNSHFMFVYSEVYNTVFGISLELCEYLGVAKQKVYKLLKNQEYIHDTKFIGSDIRKVIGSNTHYILPLYTYLN